MKINQVICQGLILSLLTAFPVFAKTETSKVNVTPDKRFSSVKCETIKGRVDSSDPVFNQAPNSRYDGYMINAEVGTIVFAELSVPQEDYSRFNPLFTFDVVNKNSGLSVFSLPPVLFGDVIRFGLLPRHAWYFSSPKDVENFNYNLYISSTNAGKYELKIAYAKPSIDFSKSQIQEVVRDSSPSETAERKLDILDAVMEGTTYKKKPYLVDVNSLCQ
jgi:hypothetical protein